MAPAKAEEEENALLQFGDRAALAAAAHTTAAGSAELLLEAEATPSISFASSSASRWQRVRTPLGLSGVLAFTALACVNLSGTNAREGGVSQRPQPGASEHGSGEGWLNGARAVNLLSSGGLRRPAAAAPEEAVELVSDVDVGDCLSNCYGVSGHCDYCKEGEACCSQADANLSSNPLECRGVTGYKTKDQYECVVAAKVTLSHWQQDCWYACGGHSGYCQWCGEGNACCRADWAHTDGSARECDQAVGFRTGVHECVHAGWLPGAPTPAPYPKAPLGAACSAHPKCEDMQGECCPPTAGGENLDCCEVPTPTPTDPDYHTELPAAGGTYSCSTNWMVNGTHAMEKKGICMDDTTLEWCPGEIPTVWPNTNEKVRSIRMFKAWADYLQTDKQTAWKQIKRFTEANDATILLGVAVTCNESADDIEWNYAKDFIRFIGPKSIMGLAIGNEMELLQFKSKEFVNDDCLRRLWDKRGFIDIFKRRVADMDSLDTGFKNVPVTSVWSGYSLGGGRWREEWKARVDSFMVSMNMAYGQRFVYTFNLYPYFDTGFSMEWNGKCWGAVNKAVNFVQESIVPTQARMVRYKMWQTTSRYDDKMWVGETGWSWPMSTTLSRPMSDCSDFSSEDTYRKFYTNFLKWDLHLGKRMRPPDHVFYFTVHDSVNFGLAEHFGLIADCRVPMCKLQAPK